MYKPNIVVYDAILMDIFELRTKPTIYIQNTIIWNDEIYTNQLCYGLYIHSADNKIVIDRESAHDRTMLFAIMAHEYCHAWQYENGLEVDHELIFGAWVNYFRVNYGVDINTMCEV